MIKVFATVEGQKWDISQMMKQITWSGSLNKCMRTLSMSYMTHDLMPITYLPSGTEIEFIKDDQQIFTGRLLKPSKNLKSGSGTFTAYDYSVFLSQSSVSLKYRNATANEIIEIICGRYGLNLIRNSKLASHQSDKVFNKTGIATINQVLQVEREKTGKSFFTRTEGKTIQLLEEGEVLARYALDPNQNLTDVNLSEDALGSVNEVEIVNRAGEVIDRITDQAAIEKIGGRFTKAIQYSKDWQSKARETLKPVKYTYDFKGLTENVDLSYISGNKVKYNNPSGAEYFIIESDVHTFDATKHSVDMKLKLIEEAS